MNMMPRLGLAFGLLMSGLVQASTQNITENFTGTTTQNAWESYNACLTAGSSSSPGTQPVLASSIPGCSTKDPFGHTETGGYQGSTSSASFPDPNGKGALRLTNNANNEAGAIISTTPFDASNGVNITFISETYQGDSGGPGGDGADGMSFFLLDASNYDLTSANTYNAKYGTSYNLLSYNPTATNIATVKGNEVVAHLGSFGGSLGYTCSNDNNPYTGIVGGYMGLGIDEYGNYLNGATQNGWNDNTASGLGADGQTPSEIGLRGKGNVSWDWIWANYGPNSPNSSLQIYDSSVWGNQAQVVQNTCATGTLYGYSDNQNGLYQAQDSNGNPIPVNDYTMIPGGFAQLPIQIANESAANRQKATPITYQLQITSLGKLTLTYSINGGAPVTVLYNQDITSNNGNLPPTLYFGFAGSTGGSRNIHEISCFKAVPSDISSTSASLNSQQSGQVQTNTQVYLASYHPVNWWGSLVSDYLVVSGSGTAATVTVASTPNWDATCQLTGSALLPVGTCPTTVGAQNPLTGRVLLTWNPAGAASSAYLPSSSTLKGAPQPFEWTNLTSTQQGTLGNQNELNYLRGVRSKEQSNGGIYRNRTSVLADIQNSSPTWTGGPSAPFTGTWKDALYPSTSMAENSVSYTTFATTYATRLNVVYVGANDGFMHGFRSGSYNSTGGYISTYNDGMEVLGYMPQAIFNNINNTSNKGVIDYSSPSYAHNYFVDATPNTGDLYYKGAWHSWLVSGVGGGGADIFALDVTNPNNFSEVNANSLVIGDWTNLNITCVSDTRAGEAATACGKNLGQTFGQPHILRLHDGNWAIVFGNGLNSSNGSAGIFIMEVNSGSGAMSFRYIDTGNTQGKDGITYIAPADLDGDHITDYIYAGDLLGNIWRFDLTSNTATSWRTSSFTGGSTPSPLFNANLGGVIQPITTKPVLVTGKSYSSQPRMMVDFGTGRLIGSTWNSQATYASGQQYLYGVWDWNMAAWNAMSGSQYASLTAPQSITTSALQTQTISMASGSISSSQILGIRTISSNTVCWQGSTACSSATNNQYGWKVLLPGGVGTANYEQIIYNPTLAYNALFMVNTTIPPINTIYNCQSLYPTGWTMAIDPIYGGVPGGPNNGQSVFSASNNYVFSNTSPIVGVMQNATGSVAAVTISTGSGGSGGTGTPAVLPGTPPKPPKPPSGCSSSTLKVTISNTTSGQAESNTAQTPTSTCQLKRLNWMQLR